MTSKSNRDGRMTERKYGGHDIAFWLGHIKEIEDHGIPLQATQKALKEALVAIAKSGLSAPAAPRERETELEAENARLLDALARQNRAALQMFHAILAAYNSTDEFAPVSDNVRAILEGRRLPSPDWRGLPSPLAPSTSEGK